MSNYPSHPLLANVTETIVDDLVEFYTAGSIFYLRERKPVRIGSDENNTKALLVKYIQEDAEQVRTRVFETSHLNAAFINAIDSGYLCCANDMIRDGVGYGCAHDVDIILQFAIFEKVIYG